MSFRSPLRVRHSAFTRAELLAVVAITAILLGFVIPCSRVVDVRMYKVKAKTDAVQTVAAVDGSHDNWVPVPYLDFPAPSGSNNLPATCVKEGCAAWSVGKDGKIGRDGDFYYNKSGTAPSDDAISWR